MGVRPSVGFTYEEAEAIIDEVKAQNDLYRIHFTDTWWREL
jgi:hypothetical protein